MKYKVDFDERGQIWCVTIVGQIDMSEFREIIRKLWEHDAYASAEVAMWDMSKCAPNFSFDEINELGLWLADSTERRGPNKVALVAPSDLGFGNSRIYAGMQQARGFDIEVFRDRKSVYEWTEGSRR
ncbi:MAG: hypothetical protein AAF387_21075 [Pseudomonadota bacterium]